MEINFQIIISSIQNICLDVVPMKGDQIITDINSNKASIDRLMLHFEDNTVDYLNLTYKRGLRTKQLQNTL